MALSLQANLDKDVIVSPANEYEVLQLLLSDCRDRLTNFNSTPSCRGMLLYSNMLYRAAHPCCHKAESSVVAGPGSESMICHKGYAQGSMQSGQHLS